MWINFTSAHGDQFSIREDWIVGFFSYRKEGETTAFAIMMKDGEEFDLDENEFVKIKSLVTNPKRK